MRSMVIQTVQVGVMTAFVPPGSFILGGAVFGPAVIILIFGAKGVTTMTRKGITGSSCRTNTRALDYSAKYISHSIATVILCKSLIDQGNSIS